eukprot:sb/3473332/
MNSSADSTTYNSSRETPNNATPNMMKMSDHVTFKYLLKLILFTPRSHLHSPITVTILLLNTFSYFVSGETVFYSVHSFTDPFFQKAPLNSAYFRDGKRKIGMVTCRKRPNRVFFPPNRTEPNLKNFLPYRTEPNRTEFRLPNRTEPYQTFPV